MARGNCSLLAAAPRQSAPRLHGGCRDAARYVNNELTKIWLQKQPISWRFRELCTVKMSEEQPESFNSWELNGLNSLDLWDYTVELECMQGTEG